MKSTRSKTRVQVVGTIVKMQEKKASNGSKFFILDLQPITGHPLRIQAWDDAYNYIVENNLHECEGDIPGSIIFADCYYHTYELTIAGKRTKFVTFKADKISRPGAQFVASGIINELEPFEVETFTNEEFGFTFIPETYGNPEPIHCIINRRNPIVKHLKEGMECTIIGDVDNRDKKIFKTYVESITDYEIEDKAPSEQDALNELYSMIGVDAYGN